ncbi:hypothetical protein DRP77_08610 [Candidatus Poribacteria bacterium]|nr:MAG: hypothetical protein DRP77_08610 [Candidatus Poribacteria bacterium]
MYRRLGEARLKTGEVMEVGVVEAPDEEHAPGIASLLAHKPPIFKWHIERSLREELDQLETRFYIGKLGDEVIANVMTVEHLGVGILGHVFTRPDHRRKGACTAVMSRLMEDFRGRGGRALYLGTGYDSPPYWIYHSFGFRSVVPGSGFMRYFTSPDFEESWFAPSDVRVKEVEWHDWGKMTALTGIVEGDWLRSVVLPIYGPTNFEGGFLGLKKELEEGKRFREVKLMESKGTGATVGFAILADDPRWKGDVCLLDLFVHPNFWEEADELLDSLNLPDKKVQCYADSRSKRKIDLLLGRGFEEEGVMKGQISKGRERLDVLIFGLTP